MEKLPYRQVTIETPVGVQTKGKAIDAEVCLPPVIWRASAPTFIRVYVASASFVRKYCDPF